MSRKLLLAGTALVFIPSLAAAGGLERTITRLAPLFEEGRYLEFGASYVFSELEGQGGTVPPTFGGPIPLSGSTGDLLENFAQFNATYKADINDRLSYAIFLNQPYGADTLYPTATAPPPAASAIYQNSNADVTTVAITGLLAYDVTSEVKLYGGPIIQAITPQASVRFLSNYNVDAGTDYGYGYMLGGAYSMPEIAFRASLTYRSEIKHDLDTTESSAALGVNSTKTTFNTPDSLTFDIQSGVAEDTLVFAQIHWADWSEFDISPPNYTTLTRGRALVAYQEDWITYTLGLGRRFDKNWSGAVSVVYEPQTNQELTSLGPVDGRTGVNLGATYETEEMEISGGISYSQLGDARNVLNTDFNSGTAIGIGFRIGFKL